VAQQEADVLAQHAQVAVQRIGHVEAQRRAVRRVDRQPRGGEGLALLPDDLHRDFLAMRRLGVAGAEHAVSARVVLGGRWGAA